MFVVLSSRPVIGPVHTNNIYRRKLRAMPVVADFSISDTFDNYKSWGKK